MATRSNLCDLYGAVAGSDPDRTALVDGATGETLTYGEFDRRVARVGGALSSLGVGTGDRVALAYTNCLTYLELLFGAAHVGAVPVPVNPEASRTHVAHVFADVRPSALVVQHPVEGSERVFRAAAAADGVGELVVDSAGSERPGAFAGDTAHRLDPLLADAPPTDRAETRADDPALQQYTSGSTGRPKGVVLTHGGVEWNVSAFVRHLSLDENERALVCTPLYHKNAMTGAVKPMLSVGGRTVVMPEFDADAVLDALDRYDVTYMTGVPTIYKRLVSAHGGSRAFPALTWSSCGSASVPEALYDEFEDAFGAELLEVYGLTEGGPVVTHSPREGRTKRGSAGTALPGVETLVVDPDTDDPLPAGELGELLVWNPGLGEYYERPDATARSFVTVDGRRYLRTGDLVVTDADGYHFVHGRRDDMLIVGGENYYPTAIEDVLQHHEAVTDAAVVGVDHDEKGTAPVAFVVPSGDVSEAALRQYVIERMPANAHPRRVFFRKSLPLTGTRKVDRSHLEAEAASAVDGSL
jgi:acyl-CoA synthetase (AMP-forming)/AMP-acid ligase II